MLTEMSSAQAEMASVEVHVENVGGITEAEVAFPPGVTVLVGQNATNRTSLLQGITAALGSESASLKGDSDEGYAELTIGGETYFQRAERRNGSVHWEGDPYLDDPVAADLFAFFLESNEARRAVSQGRDLREIILRPIDTAAIEHEITRLQNRRQALDDRLAELDELEEKRESLEVERERLESEIEDIQTTLEEKRSELSETGDSWQSDDPVEGELESRMEDLRQARSELDDVQFSIDTELESIQALESDLESVSAELAEVRDADVDGSALEAKIREKRETKRNLDSRLNELQRLVQFNREMLADESTLLGAALGDVHDRTAEDVTQELVDGETTICWTCGTRVATDRVASTVDALRDYREDLLDEQRAIERELDDLESRQDELADIQRRREDLESRRDAIEREIADREETVEELRHRKTDLEDRVETLEADVEELEAETDDQVLEGHEAVNDLEYELGRAENELDRIESNLTNIEDQLETRAELRKERKSVKTELQEARERVDSIERRAVEQFNEHMENILDILAYENISRIWLERRVESDGAGRRTDDRAFDLHIVREGEDGAVYEDSIDHLSESERRLTGLVFGLAGYLSHDLYEDLPFVILDSLEAIDAQRIAALLDYVRDYAGYLVVALLPEDAEYVEDYERIETIA